MFQKYTKEFRYNITLSVPVITGMLGHSFVQFADNIMVGQLGTAELAAVSLGNSFVFIAMSLGIGFSTAITPLVAEADGAGNDANAKSALKHGLVLCTLLGVSLFGLILLAKPLMYLMDQPPEVVTLAIPYLDIVAFSLIPLIVFQAFKQFSEGLSQTKYPMFATILANVVNIVLNYLLIFGAFGFPKLGDNRGCNRDPRFQDHYAYLSLWGLLRRKKPSSRAFVTGFNFKNMSKERVMRKIIDSWISLCPSNVF